MFGALVQLIHFGQWEEQSWLPGWVFTWDLRILSTLDAYHVYQGLWLVLFGAGFYVLGFTWWVWIAVVVVGYWQVYNLFYHIIFRRREYWRWPIG
jgi:hypothetical protein